MTSRLRLIAIVAVVACLAVAGLAFLRASDTVELKADFAEAKGIYVGDDVTVLGVPVGKITDISAKPDKVTITMEIDADRELPADAKAAVVSKSLVSIRSIVIGPVYEGGDKLQAGDTIPIERTTVPVEWDEVKDELVRLTEALGPNGSNENGATSDLVRAGATFLDGKGATINQTIKDLNAATKVLAENKGDTFATVRNLQVFVEALNSSDAQIRSFEENIARAAQVLDANTASITAGVENFKALTTTTEDFFANQGQQLASTLESFEKITSLLYENRQPLADTLQLAPTALSNFYNILDPRTTAASGELVLTEYGHNPTYLMCGALLGAQERTQGSLDSCRQFIGPLADVLKVSAPGVGLSPLSGSGVGPELVRTPEEANILGKTPEQLQDASVLAGLGGVRK